MLLRKLDVSEHPGTRALWESVFAEDTKAFLDYYYYVKTRENEIYVIEENEMVSMLQLNPYELKIGCGIFDVHYIIGVATEKAYRSRGYMRELLLKGMEEMYRRKEPFTFLMPAAEAIYRPYDFRFVYRQRQGVLSAKKRSEAGSLSRVEVREARFSDCDALAGFFQKEIAPFYQVIATHTPEYYRTMIQEQQSENGGVCVLTEDGQIAGLFAYAKEEGWEVREPVCLAGYEDALADAIRTVCCGEEAIPCFGYEEAFLPEMEDAKYKDMIMVRILHLDSLLHMLQVKEGEELDCSFAVLDPWITQNNRIWHLESQKEPRADEEQQEEPRAGEEQQEESMTDSEPQGRTQADEENFRKICVRETEDSQGVITIGALTSFLFGYKSIEEIEEEENVILTESLKEELCKLEVLDHIFLNEIV